MNENTKALTQHFTLGKLFKYVLPTIFAVLLASLYTIVEVFSSPISAERRHSQRSTRFRLFS